MSPEQRTELIERTVAGAPPLNAEQIAGLRQLLPPTVPAETTAEASRQEVLA